MDTSQTVVAIVDDDEAVRIATSSLVRAMGWSVQTFESADAFLQSEHLSNASCLISDVLMPGMSGVLLHATLRGLGYALPTIFITGFPTPDLQAEVLANGALVLLGKPVSLEDISHWVGVALGDSKST
ncbi:response regulator [Paraburkholderia sp. JHI869]|uniref:response regulator transcription factor n=1 Tax=Paraburkholderia sp. JHI869 TaxID=3112959 RepID=UPI0031757977